MPDDAESVPDTPHGRMRRLSREHYRGFAFVLWNMTVAQRATGWLTTEFHLRFRELQLHALARHDLMCPAYCLMPDHMHMFWIGLSEGSDQHLAARFFRRHLSALLWRGGVSLQKQAWDVVLSEKERERGAVNATIFYIAENPVRKRLVADARDWAFSGVQVPGYPEMDWRAADFPDRLWSICAKEVERRRDGSGHGEQSEWSRIGGRPEA
jgi:REP element-mobilizing transposase RayT